MAADHSVGTHKPACFQARQSLLQVGDWGRLGEYNQSRVAEAMALRANKLHLDFVLGMGDNFYPSRLQELANAQTCKKALNYSPIYTISTRVAFGSQW